MESKSPERLNYTWKGRDHKPLPLLSNSGTATNASNAAASAPPAGSFRRQQPPTFLNQIRQSECCAKCSRIPYVETLLRNDITHHDFKTLRVSASRGCPVCRFFYQEVAIQPHLQSVDESRDARMRVIQRGNAIELIDFSLKSKMFELYQRRDGPRQSIQTTSLRDVQPHPLSERCWNIAEDWVRTCISEHQKCRTSSDWLLPTRVIDVSGERPRLIEGSGVRGLYTALSHCWGQGHHPLSHSTSKTIDDFYCGIDVFDLPKSFQDAIEVTRKLKIQYLWIDSLCIIQDLIEDWQREAQRMGIYYQNCFLTISALDAPENDTGFLMPRQTYPSVHLEGNLYLRPATRSWRRAFQESPLSRRAWVLQERLVSARVLHYGRDDMFWECLTCSTRESDLTQHELTDHSVEWLDENFKRSLLFPSVDTAEALKKWYSVVAQYSRLSMSHESDMLPAISAVAERIGQATGYVYLLGLWEQDLHTGLLWYADGPRSAPRIWRAPSWSWAQLTGPVIQLHGPRSSRRPSKYDITVLGTRLERHDAQDMTTPIQDASLWVLGYTAPVWMKGSHGDPPYNNPSLKLIVDIYDENGIPIGTGFLDTFLDNSPTRQCTALAISERSDPEIGMGESWLFFLLIEPCETDGNFYRRIGIGQAFDPFRGSVFDGVLFDKYLPEELVLV